MDEADSFAKLSEELRGILNAGHTRDTAFVLPAEGDGNEPRLFSTWGPKVVAAIGRLPDTIEDRAIRLALVRKPTSIDKRDAFDPEGVRAACGPIRARLARFTFDNLDAIARAEVERLPGLHDRAWNNWRPLLMIASAAGPVWLERAEASAKVVCGAESDEEGDDIKTLALRHVWEVVEPAGKIATADVLTALVARDDGSPWAKWWEARLAKDELRTPAAGLARMLRPFGIRARQLWIDDKNVRGYEVDDFRRPSVAAYLEIDPGNASDARTGSSTQAGSSVPSDANVKSEGAGTHMSDDGAGDPAFVEGLADVGEGVGVELELPFAGKEPPPFVGEEPA